ncbi:glutamate-rich protein 6B [Lepus europaeus]|uniref:glutamate-rich protein 6B n=1 Tax=Lepus europaeus TaxID=9983 RepID=UPI002B476965|nr:glutamate-rich protein 6B [Lepus europaeus]
MSAENSQSPGASPPTTSHHSTQILSSEEEEVEAVVDEENLQDASPSPEEEESFEEEEYLQEDEYLYEEKYLERKDYLYGRYLQEGEYLDERKYLEKGNYVFMFCTSCAEKVRNTIEWGKVWRLQISQSPSPLPLPTITSLAPTSQMQNLELDRGEFKTMFPPQTTQTLDARSSPMMATHSPVQVAFKSPPSTSEVTTESYTYSFPSSSMRDQDSQTEWTYEKKLEYSVSEIDKEYEDGMEPISDRNLRDALLEEAGKQETEDFDVSMLSSSYQTVFRMIIREMTALSELDEDFDIPLTRLLESQNKKKLRMLLKKNFEKYKEAILWILRRREGQRATETSTLTFSLSAPKAFEEPKEEVTAQPVVPVRRKKLEVDTEWIKQKIQAHRADGKIVLYPNKKVFQILFPDGTGQIHYPSGNLALLILCTQVSKFTYIVLEDSTETWLRALINNSGSATFYDDNRDIWLNLSSNLGYYFPKGKHTKAWNWWNLGIHVHTPPVQPISLKINRYIKVHIRSQDKIILHFIHEQKRICLNLGTRYKLTTPEVLCEMGKTAILQVEPGLMVRKIQTLLRRMSRALNSLPVRDLEKFAEAARLLLENKKKKEILSQLWILALTQDTDYAQTYLCPLLAVCSARSFVPRCLHPYNGPRNHAGNVIPIIVSLALPLTPG